MESFLPSEIARLVLGYLEDHRCEEAYETFLRTSSHLEECLAMREEGRKFRTQVMGLKLLDILYEYSAIFSLVQERLKKVDPETASSLKKSGSLLDKITFLLNATSSGQTMLFSITLPPGKSPSTVAHVRKRLRTTSSSDKKRDYLRKHSRTHIEEFSPIVELDENVVNPSALETTSLSSLPGNANVSLDRTQLEGTDIVRTPKRKAHLLNSSRPRSNSQILEDEDNLDITALTKALLGNHELHEKIAENINKVISTPELAAGTSASQMQDLCSAQNPSFSETNSIIPNNFTFELDNAIKKIVKDTESDPLFENFLQDIVCIEDETSDDGEDRGISDTSTPCQSTPETVKKMSLKHRLRSSKKRTESITSSSDFNTPTKIDNQNAAAIESIIQMQAKELEPSTSGVQTKAIICKESEQVNEIPQLIITKPSSTHTTNIQPQIAEKSSTENIALEEQKTGNQNKNLLIAQQPAPIIITDKQDNRLVILSSKMTNTGSQVLTVQPAQFQTQNFSEDILTMPTVIINDDQNLGSTYIVPQKIFPTVESTIAVERPPTPPPKITRNPLILPHPIISSNITTIPADTITYTFNVQTQPIPGTTVENTITKLVQNSVTKIITSDPITKQNPVSKLVTDPKPSTSKQVEETTARSVPMISISSGKKEDKLEQKLVTPVKSDKKVQHSLSSPRTSRSHIRALDFSNPAVENCRSLSSPKLRSRKIPKTPKQNRSLFTSPLNLPIATRSPHAKLQGDWDGSELIFGPSQSPRKTRSSERSSINNVEEVHDENNCVKSRSVINMNEEEKDSEPVKSEAKIEVPIKTKSKKTSSWDQDLRAHIEPVPPPCKQKKVRKRIKVVDQNVAEQNVKDIANKTEEDGKTIEVELAKIQNNDSSKENIETQNKTEETKESVNKPVAVKPAKATKQRRQTKTKNVVLNSELEVKSKEISVNEGIIENNTQDIKKPRAGMRNIKPRVYKKCILKTTRKTVTNSEEIKIEEMKKTINEPSTSAEMAVNVTPMLETPLKNDSLMLPITPGLMMTPFDTDASFSNLIKQNCGSVDLSGIITPNFPMTPSFPITPSLQTGDSQSSYASRPTDYSNSSSYYQPSDTEQNQKIDQVLIEEAMKMEASTLKKKIWTSTPDKEGLLQNKELSVPPTDSMPNSSGDKIKSKDLLGNNSNETLESTKTSVDCSYSTSGSDTSTISSSSFDADETKENVSIEPKDNTTVIRITPGRLRSGGKHMAMLEKFVKPDNVDIESDKSEPRENQIKIITPKERITSKSSNRLKKIEKNIGQTEEKTITSKEKLIKLEEKVNKLKEKVNNYEEKVNKTEELVKKTDDDCIGRKLNSHVTKVHCPLLHELELKRQRIIAELKTESNNPKPKPKPERKGRSKVEVSTRVTRSKSTSRNKDDNNKKSTNKTVETENKQKSVSLKRYASIEDVAARLKKNNFDAPDKYKTIDSVIEKEIPKLEDKKIKSLLLSPNTSIESRDSCYLKERNLTPPIEDEEYRLHISSEEDTDVTLDKTKDEDDLDIVRVLKERGIHLIPNKTPDKKIAAPVKDEDNHDIINTQVVNLNIPANILDQNTDIEDSIPLNKIDKKIEIKSCINLEEAKKIDVSKILSHITKDKIESKNKETEILVTKEEKVSEITKKIANEPETIKEIIKEPETKMSNEISEISKEVNEEVKNLTEMTYEAEESLEVPNDLKKAIEMPKVQNMSQEIENPEFDEELFHVKIVTEDSPEFIQIIHDECAVILKSIDDYNFDVLKKQISAKVFLEELNVEQDRVLSVTPFIEIVSLPAKVPKVVLKPLDILFNELVDDSSVDTIFEEPTITKSKTCHSKKIQSKTQNISRRPTEKQDNETNKKNESSQQKSNTIKSNSNASMEIAKKTISLEQYKTKQNKKTIELEEKVINKMKQDDDTKLMLNSEEDSLLEFAVTGSENMLKNESTVNDLNPKKRKADADSSKPTCDKRVKPNTQLLKIIDVDQFLSKIHGPTDIET